MIPHRPGIYQLRNLITEDRYIGQSRDLSRRSQEHYTELQHHRHFNRYLQVAFDLNQESNLTFEVLLICEVSELTYYEQKFVDIFKPEYNILRECVDTFQGISLEERRRREFERRLRESRLKVLLGHLPDKR